MHEEVPPWVRRYGAALLCVAGALAARWVLELLLDLDPRYAYITFFPALMVAGYVGGLGPGLLATALAALAAQHLVIEPRGAMGVHSADDAGAFVLFLLVGGLMSWLNELLHRAVHRAEATEARLRATLASIGDGVIVTDPKGRVQFLNPVAQMMTGWAPAQAAGQPLRHVFALQHENGRPAEDPAARALGDDAPAEPTDPAVLRARDGREWPVDNSAAPVRTDDGRTLGVVLVFRDVSERREAEEALREREATLRSFYDSAPLLMGVVELLPDDLLHLADNAAAGRVLGLRPDLPRPARGRDLGFGREQVLLWQERCREADRAGRPVTFEYAHPTRAGKRWLCATVSRVGGPGPRPRFCFVVLDDTQRKRALEALRRQAQVLARSQQETAESYAQLDSLLTHAPIGFAFFDRGHRYVRINPFLAAINGLPAAEHLDRPIREVLPVNAAVVEPILEEVFATGEPVREREVCGETPLAPGQRRHWLTSFYPVRAGRSRAEGAAGGVKWVGAVVVEITERKRMEAELRRQADELAENDRRKDAFLAMLGHELRNPLSPIRSAVDLLRHYPPEEEGKALVGTIERQVRHLTRLVGDLLDTSRIIRGLVELRKEAVDVADVAARAAEAARPALEEKRHRLALALPAGPLVVDADPVRLEQVLANLLHNAAKYTPPEGRIALTAGREGGEAVLRVQDNGIGIRPEFLPRLFDLFTQGDRLPGAVSEGLGLGLTLVRGLVGLHGGRVGATSPGPGQGSTFEVRLPLPKEEGRRRKEPCEQASAHPPSFLLAPLKVLVVDDNVDAALTLAMVLRREGHEVEVAHDGAATLAVAPAQRPDVIFLDIGLPGGLDGYEVARRLRAGGLGPVRLVALTGYGQEEDRRRSAEAGFDAHLVKPVGFDELQGMLRPPDGRPE